MPKAGAVVLSDYAKSVLTERVIRAIIEAARWHGKPEIVDPKGHDYRVYRGATMIMPNAKELAAAVHRPLRNEAEFAAAELATGTKLRVLTIVDTFSRFSPAIEPRFNFHGADVVEVLERVGRAVGLPAVIRVDQGSEFVSRDLDLWAYQRGVTLDFSRPGKPTDNAFIESFNGKLRAECLNATGS